MATCTCTGRVGAVVEHVWVRRTDLTAASAHTFWDVGPRAAAEATYALFGPLVAGARAGVTWFPTARAVAIPDVGRDQLNTISLQGTFFLRAVINSGRSAH